MFIEKYIDNIVSSSGWASDEALASSNGCLQGSWTFPPQEGGVVLYNHNNHLIVDGGNECRHCLIVGTTGTGKTRLTILPSLVFSLRAKNKRSYVIFDVKGELKAETLHLAHEENYQIFTIDFRTPDKSDKWNPFFHINAMYANGIPKDRETAKRELEKIIACIFNDGDAIKVDKFWRTNSANLFRCICYTLWNNKQNLSLKNILNLSDSIPDDDDYDSGCLLFRLVDQTPENSTVKRLLSGFRKASNITRGNILSSYRGYLSPFIARDDIVKMVSANTSIDFQQLGLKPSVLYISLPDDSTAMGDLQGILLTQLNQSLNECALQHGCTLPVRTDIYLDEFCNIKPAIPSMDTALAIARSRGIRYILAIQSYAQLCTVYGSASETIAANCSTWIAFNIAKDETFRNKLSQLCGNNSLGEPLITPSQLALLSYEQAIILRERCAPYFTRLEDISKVMNRLENLSTQPEHDRNNHCS